MYRPIPRHLLEATNRVDVQFSNGVETQTVSGSGSGFWVADESDNAMFITNRHLVDLAYLDKKYLGAGYRLSRLTVSSHSTDPRNQGVVVDLNSDDNDIEIQLPTSDDVDIVILIPRTSDFRTPPFTIPAYRALADHWFFEDLPWGTQVSFASFQAWRDSTTQKPILRTGIVSSDPRDDYSSDMVNNRKSALLLEAFSFSGSSGSPIFVSEGILGEGKGRNPIQVIGIMCGHIWNDKDTSVEHRTHVGLSYCHKSTVLLEMLNRLGSLERLRID